jgi:L-ascorbate metabolism protein UlaG (beta-lactamase superfamily)
MIITYHGGQFIKISQGDLVIAANPFGKQSKLKPIRFGARIALMSANHPDMNGVENLSHGEKVPFVIAGPGEYEVAGIAISGFPSPKPYSKEGLLNTIYTIEFEGIRVCILGALSSAELPPELFEGIGEVDILIAPISGEGMLTPSEAAKMGVVFGAKIVIPVSWSDGGENQLKAFLKDAGAEGVTPIEKLTLKKKDLEGKEGEVVVLEPLTHA